MEEVSDNIKKEQTLNKLRGRSELIDNYEKGTTTDLKLNPWEDPEVQIYHCIDRYGFISDEKSENEQKENSKKGSERALRVHKWLKICQSWKHYQETAKLRDRVYKGVPLQVKARVWLLLLAVQETIDKNPGVYEKMKNLGKSWGLELKQIDLDVNRTYRNHIMFRRRYDVKQQALFNLLVAYSVYNSEVGYCQGMSQIAALLLMFLNEEEAFWAFSNLMTAPKHKMHGFFIAKFPKLSRYQEHYNKALKKSIPKLKKHLDKNEMFPNLYTVKWFLQCFLDRLPFTLTLRFWDIYILEGESVLIAMAVTVMKMHKNSLLQMDMEGMMEFFTSHISHAQPLTDDKIISLLRSTYIDLRRWKLAIPACSEVEEEEEGIKKDLASYEKPSVQELMDTYADDDTRRGGERREEGEVGVEIPADGGKEHLPSFTKHRFSRMIDFESESEDADVKDVDFEISRLSSRTSLTNSDLPSPATSLASPARLTLHKRFRNTAVTPSSFDDDNSVFSSSSSLSSQQTSLLRKRKKENSLNAFEMLQSLNDMLPPVSSSSGQPVCSDSFSTQALSTQSSQFQTSLKPQNLDSTKYPLYHEASLHNQSRNPSKTDETNHSSATVCNTNQPSPIPSPTSIPHQRPNIFKDSIFSPNLKSQLFNHSFKRKNPLLSEGSNVCSNKDHNDDTTIPIFHIPPSPLQQSDTPSFQSNSIRSRLSLHHWPTALPSKVRPLSTHLTQLNPSPACNSRHNTQEVHNLITDGMGYMHNTFDKRSHPINLNYNSVPTSPSNSLTPITVLHLKTVSPLHLPTSYNTSSSSSTPPKHRKLLLSSTHESVDSTCLNNHRNEKQTPTLHKPLLFSSLKPTLNASNS